MKNSLWILAAIFVLIALVVLYGVRTLWRHNKFISILLIFALLLLGYIFYPMIKPLFW